MANARRQSNRHGYVVIDKPAGWTSHDVVARVRRIVGERRVGHAGTLDPAAVGVLPIAVGLATRTIEYLSKASKSYRAEVTFGIETDTLDGDGRVISTGTASNLDEQSLRRILGSFLGTSLQQPPHHAAIKVGGKKLYELARQGNPLVVEARPVTFHRLELLDWTTPVLTLDVCCSKGTYIRSLARDLGEATGAGAYLSHLVRTRSGPFTLDDAVTLAKLPGLIESRGWSNVAFHPDWALLDRDCAILPPDLVERWRRGLPVRLSGCAAGPVRVYNDAGAWLGVGDSAPEAGSITPRKVIPVELNDA